MKENNNINNNSNNNNGINKVSTTSNKISIFNPVKLGKRIR